MFVVYTCPMSNFLTKSILFHFFVFFNFNFVVVKQPPTRRTFMFVTQVYM